MGKARIRMDTHMDPDTGTILDGLDGSPYCIGSRHLYRLAACWREDIPRGLSSRERRIRGVYDALDAATQRRIRERWRKIENTWPKVFAAKDADTGVVGYYHEYADGRIEPLTDAELREMFKGDPRSLFSDPRYLNYSGD